MYYNEYFRKILIPSWEKQKNLLYTWLKSKNIDASRFAYFDPLPEEINHWSYGLHDWIVSQSFYSLATTFPPYRVYIIPPGGIFNHHIDGGAHNRYPIALNLPLSGYIGSITAWWDEQTAVMETGYFGVNGLLATRILNLETIRCLESVEINQPTLIRSDVIHSVCNSTNDPRFCLVVRWNLQENRMNEWNEIMLDI